MACLFDLLLFHLPTVVLMVFEAFYMYLGFVWLVSVHLVTGQPFSVFVLWGLAICFRGKMLCFFSRLFVF